MKRYLIALVALALMLTAVPALGETGTLSLTLTGGQFDTGSARSMLSLVNALRTGDDAWYWNEDNTNKIRVSGLSALKYDYALERVAMLRAAEIAVYYAHARPDGSSCFTAYPDELRWSCGENIAYGQSSTNAAYTAWAEEDKPYSGQGHRRNMLDSGYKSIGIGCYVCNGVRYWVQEFSSKTTSTSSNPLTLPLTISALESNIAALSGSGDVRLDIGERVLLSDIGIASKGGNNRYTVPCSIQGMTWRIEDTSIAVISKGTVLGKTTGTTNLLGTVGGLTATVRVKVSGPLPTIAVEVSGTMSLDPNNSSPNLVLKIPAVTGAQTYLVERYTRESGQTIENTLIKPSTLNLYIQTTDATRPLHMTVTVTARDERNEDIARFTRNVVLYPASGVLRLPTKLKTISAQAFTGANAVCAIVPDGCTTIGAKAFANCAKLCSVRIPASVTSIADDAFTGCDAALVIFAPKGSAAATFAQSKGYAWFELN